MFHRNSERGQALILIAFAAIGLFAFSALAIDGSRAFSNKRHAQNAADTAALAAALAEIRTPGTEAVKFAAAVDAAKQRAASNGYVNGANITVQVNLCSDAGVTCDALPTGAVPKEYIRVRIVSTIPTTFGRVIGRQTLTAAVEAIARAQGSTAGGAFFNGAGIATLKPNGDSTLWLNGNANLKIKKSGTYVNSNANCAMKAWGNITMSVDTSYDVVGTLCEGGNVHRTGAPTKAHSIPYPPTLNIPEPSIACSGAGKQVGNTLYPGIWSNQMLIESAGIANVTLAPGNYCLQKGARFNGNVNITANDVNIRLLSGEFILNGNTTFTCTNAIFFSDGGEGFRFNGNGTNKCTNVFFYTRTGEVKWNGNVANTFEAPTSGPYKGLLIYLPYENKTELQINGNSGNSIKGTILAVASNIKVNGNSGSEVMNSQIVGYTVELQGNGELIIDYDANENYTPPASPTIELTK